MKVKPGNSIEFKGTIYKAGDELPVNYVSEEGCVAKGPHTKLVGENDNVCVTPKKSKKPTTINKEED